MARKKAQPAASTGRSHMAFLSLEPVKRDSSRAQVNRRILSASAASFPGLPLEDRLSHILQIPHQVAVDLAAGLIPYTLDMLTVLTEQLQVSMQWLTTGTGDTSLDPNQEEEREFLKAFRLVSEEEKQLLTFALGLGDISKLLPPKERAALFAGLSRLQEHRAGAPYHELLSTIVGTCVDSYQAPSDFKSCSAVMFTPFHAIAGIYGPERTPLANYLPNPGCDSALRITKR
ncbi:hypothetical protein HB746_35750 [Pseudomonas aeruginosa]|uniref:hypothetical protein n=1 Tax=Pseudomonas aeruginosa TaxID=287 RepID=UPI00155EE900|nr:hypothetical protein [Pseudomonas aeruginosa]NRC34329.1 hypothetical protein [Pseudomonas aeruginosa]